MMPLRLEEANRRSSMGRTCKKCGADLPDHHYCMDPAGPDGRSDWCHACEHTYRVNGRKRTAAASRQYYTKNRKRLLEHQKEERKAAAAALKALREGRLTEVDETIK
jgi:hypothetical protein